MITPIQVASILGRAATESEINEIHRLQDALQLRDLDALLYFFVRQIAHESALSAAPDTINAAVDHATQNSLSIAEAETRRFIAETQHNLSTQLSNQMSATLQRTAVAAADRSMTATALLIAATIAILAGASFSLGFNFGDDHGYAKGVTESRDEVAHAAWINSPEGNFITTCTQQGWVIEDGICFPQRTAKGSLYGWRLPNTRH